jgi:hypothetical protein
MHVHLKRTFNVMPIRDEHRSRVCENWVLRGISGKQQEAGENCTMRSFIICTLYQLLA